MTTPSDILGYFASIKKAHITRILPCYVTIGRRTYPAARYTEKLETPQGTEAFRRGEREYVREMIYCAGFLPSAKLQGNVAFTMGDCLRDWHEGNPDHHEWYVASFYGNVSNRKQEVATPNEFHPFGNSFLLAPWDVKDSTIDQHERVPFRRVAVLVSL